MNYAVAKLEFSPDPLSDTTPTWVDVTNKCRGADWSSGKQKDLDQAQAGGATFVLRNDGRMFEPEYVAGVFYPNIVPLRRFRLSLITAAGTFQQGIYYTTSWNVTYPAGTTYSEVVATCTDGFGLLSLDLLPALDPSSAATMEDVQASDQPFAQYLLDDPTSSTKMNPVTGPNGVYQGSPTRGVAPITLGDAGTSVFFAGATTQCGRAKMDDVNQFQDGDAFTIEAVMKTTSTNDRIIVAGPWNTTDGDHIFALQAGSVSIRTFAGGVSVSTTLTPATSGADGAIHHVAAVYDGSNLYFYLDGVVDPVVASVGGGVLRGGSAGEYLYVGGSTHVSGSQPATVQHAAFYEQPLSAARIKAHADAALRRGYAAQSVGGRVAAIATDPLWSTAGIASSSHTAMPRMKTGQSELEEILAIVDGELPWGLFYFDDTGNPAYRGWDSYGGTISAIVGDAAGEVPYTDLSLVYDDEIYNSVTASRLGGDNIVLADASSQSDFKPRGTTATDLPLSLDSDAQAVGQEILDRFKSPRFRVESISLNGASPAALPHIIQREIGDTIRVRRRGAGGTPIDVITPILGKSKSIDVNGNLTCTWNLARGFNASDGFWHLGVTGYSELGQTTVLG